MVVSRASVVTSNGSREGVWWFWWGRRCSRGCMTECHDTDKAPCDDTTTMHSLSTTQNLNSHRISIYISLSVSITLFVCLCVCLSLPPSLPPLPLPPPPPPPHVDKASSGDDSIQLQVVVDEDIQSERGGDSSGISKTAALDEDKFQLAAERLCQPCKSIYEFILRCATNESIRPLDELLQRRRIRAQRRSSARSPPSRQTRYPSPPAAGRGLPSINVLLVARKMSR